MGHEALYDGASVIRYEARCSCGWTAVAATEYDSRVALRRHLGATATPTREERLAALRPVARSLRDQRDLSGAIKLEGVIAEIESESPSSP
jgi:hypothetical protein